MDAMHFLNTAKDVQERKKEVATVTLDDAGDARLVAVAKKSHVPEILLKVELKKVFFEFILQKETTWI
ncbi:hypothetical protein TGRH88_019710 [Toxoplasma gondii]|uniref:Uncharacterized protein n=1 Tax=Toxoplasma gondii TaxID=5811 RepID=A0A7J6KGW0_TOXGO|nr:hypothetical protein TGRH88_019710 [Toxoplasma gondii]